MLTVSSLTYTTETMSLNYTLETFTFRSSVSSRLGGVFTGTEKEAILEEILKEYRREMIGDGQVFYAYKRRNAPEIEKGYLSSGVITMNVEKYTPDIPSSEYDGGRVY